MKRTHLRENMSQTTAVIQSPKFVVRWQGATVVILNRTMAQELLQLIKDFEDLEPDEMLLRDSLSLALYDERFAYTPVSAGFTISRLKGAIILQLEEEIADGLLDMLSEPGVNITNAQCALKFELKNALELKDKYESKTKSKEG